MSIGSPVVYIVNLGTGDNGLPAAFVLDPDPWEAGTDPITTGALTSNRLAGFSVALEGDIAAVATLITDEGGALGGSSDGVGGSCGLTLTRGAATPGEAYTGEIVVTDDSGWVHRFDVSLAMPDYLRVVAASQGARHIWCMATAGTSQPNLGSVATPTLTLTDARVTTTQQGAEGAFPVTAATLSITGGAFSVVVCVKVNDTTTNRAIYSGGVALNLANLGYICIDHPHICYKNALSGLVCNLATAATGVWLLAVTVDAGGAAACYARLLGHDGRHDSSGTRGIPLTTALLHYLGGDGITYNSVLGDYYFCALYNKQITSGEFDALYACINDGS